MVDCSFVVDEDVVDDVRLDIDEDFFILIVDGIGLPVVDEDVVVDVEGENDAEDTETVVVEEKIITAVDEVFRAVEAVDER